MKIECTLPNASEEISGIKFARAEDGSLVSVDDVPAAEAARLLKIEGFVAVPDDAKKANESPAKGETPPAKGETPPAKGARKAADSSADPAAA